MGPASHGGRTFLSDFDCCAKVTVVRRSLLCEGLQTSHRLACCAQVSRPRTGFDRRSQNACGCGRLIKETIRSKRVARSGDRPQPEFIDRFRKEDYFDGTPFSDAPFCERRRISIRRELKSVLTTVQNVRSFATASASVVSRSVM